MVDITTCYVRTPAGLEEIKARSRQLSREQRNLLILLDGRSPLHSYAGAVGAKADQLDALAEPLLRLGLMAPAGGSVVASAAEAGVPLRQAMVAIAERVFGAQAGAVLRKLEHAGATDADLFAAAESAAKLAKLTIDETRAAEFLVEIRKLKAG